MGFSGLPVQLLLLRELLIVFAGNELTIGLILACWLATEAAGSLWARRSEAGGMDALQRYAWVTLAFCLSLIPAIYAVRMIKPVLGISVGTVPGLGLAAAASLLVMLPVGLTHGAQFTLGCGALSGAGAGSGAGSVRGTGSSSVSGTVRGASSSSGSSSRSSEKPPAGQIYILETLGTLLAGLVWTAALVRLANPFEIAAGVILLNAGTVVYLLWKLQGDVGRTLPIAAAAAFIAASLLLPATGLTRHLHYSSVNALWQNQNIVHYENSMYGNIVITETQGQHTFFTDGTPAFLAPVPDAELVEPLIHIPLTAHPNPERVMLITGGASGFIDAVLEHPSVSRVEYIEHDPRLLQLQLKYAAAAAEPWLNDPRVDAYAADARSRLQESTERYDIIISRYHDPSNLHSSRHFSREFFQLAARSLTDQGILVLGFPGLVGHLNEPLQDLAAGVYHGLQQEFPYVRAFPGSGSSFLLASFDPTISTMDPEVFSKRLQQRRLLDAVAVPWHVEQHLPLRRSAWFNEYAAEGSPRPSRDFQPRALFLSISYWSSLNAPVAGRVLQAVYQLHPVAIAAGVVAALLLLAAALNRLSSQPRTPVVPAVLTTGFAAMLVNLSLLFAFQILAGRLFGWLGLLTAAFIAGLGIGALYTSRKLRHLKTSGPGATQVPTPQRLLIQSDVAVMLLSTLLLILLPLVAPWLFARIPATLLRLLFFPLLMAAGAVCGAQFPAACAVLTRPENPTGDGGLVYAADLLGGCLGGILGGVILLPLLGLAGAGLSVGVLKAITIFLLINRSGPVILEARP
ncbi:MAG: hypothetical protein EA428_08315 [Spirochaetaceae bacterium]|nr:MAG: hypothetical protein EA428_08315 [Spirochaetaceae bacterium]